MRRFQTYRELRASSQPRRTRIFQGIVQGLFIGFLIVNVLPKRSHTNDAIPDASRARFRLSQIALHTNPSQDTVDQQADKSSSNLSSGHSLEGSETVTLKSRLCSSSQAASAEVMEKVRNVVGERLAKYNLDDRRSVTTAIQNMKLTTSVDESFKEVAGEKYPLYSARVDVVFGKDFDANIMKLVFHRTAHNRFEWLMTASVLIVVCLIVFDQTLWESRSAAKPC